MNFPLQQYCSLFISQGNMGLQTLLAAAMYKSKTESKGVSFLVHLNYDTQLEVCSFLSVQDLGRMASVSHEVKQLVEDDSLWRRLVKNLVQQWGTLRYRPKILPTIRVRSSEWKMVYNSEWNHLSLCRTFGGLWSEKWCDVNVSQSTFIETDGRTWMVSYKKNKFTATFREFDPVDQVLTFHLEGGDSGWAFIYRVKPIAKDRLHLAVHRIHDGKNFMGELLRSTEKRADNAMGSFLS